MRNYEIINENERSRIESIIERFNLRENLMIKRPCDKEKGVCGIEPNYKIRFSGSPFAENFDSESLLEIFVDEGKPCFSINDLGTMKFDYNQLSKGYFGTAVFRENGKPKLAIEFFHERVLDKTD